MFLCQVLFVFLKNLPPGRKTRGACCAWQLPAIDDLSRRQDRHYDPPRDHPVFLGLTWLWRRRYRTARLQQKPAITQGPWAKPTRSVATHFPSPLKVGGELLYFNAYIILQKYNNVKPAKRGLVSLSSGATHI